MIAAALDQIARHKLVMIDLDGTLYREEEYLRAGYAAIGAHCGARFGIDGAALADFLIDGFGARGRRMLFQDACSRFGLPAGAIEEMKVCLHNVQVSGGLSLDPRMETLLETLCTRGIAHCVITNGTLVQQQNKIAQLLPANCLEGVKIYYAALYAPKPDPAALLAACADFGVAPTEAIMIGDSVADRGAATAAGCAYLDVSQLPALDSN